MAPARVCVCGVTWIAALKALWGHLGKRCGNNSPRGLPGARGVSAVQAAVTKTPQTGWPVSNRNLFLTVVEPDKCNIKALADLSVEFCLLLHRWLSSHVWRCEGGLGASFTRALTPLTRAPPSWSNHLHSPYVLIPSPWGLGFHTWILGTQIFSSSRMD